MTAKVALSNPLLRTIRTGYFGSIAALLVIFSGQTQTAKAAGETRTISFHHTHTKEDLTVTYKVNGRYDEEALRRINHLMRDWRESAPTKMDPEVIDLLWEVHRETGAKEPIWVVCGYRSPETNSMLRKRSSGVAKTSLHMQGKAVDFFIPGVSVEELRAAGLRAQRGGVGFYQSSNFVHLDTGSVRHWPRMPEAQLAKVLSKGQLASANASDDRSARRVTVAQADAPRSSAPASPPSFFAKLFGGGNDHEEPEAEAAAAPVQTAPAAPKIARAAMAARAPEKKAAPAAGEKVAAVPMPQAKPTRPESYQVASAGSTPVRLAQLTPPVANSNAQVANPPAANVPASNVIADRGNWQGPANAEPVENTQTTVARTTPASRTPAKVATANAAPWPIADRKSDDRAPTVGALSYAPQPAPTATRTSANTRAPGAMDAATASVKPGDEPLTTTPRKGPDVVQVGDRFNDPWTRAMMLSPSAQSFLKTTLYGTPDFRNLGPLFAKPASVVVMKFTADPTNGVSTEKFSGSSVGFTPTMSFLPRTASLR